MPTTLKRRLLRAGGWGIVKRMIKPIPVVGSLFAVGLAGYEIRKKGIIRGVVHVGLDVTPVLGTAKGVIEIFTGDLIRDRERQKPMSFASEPHTDADEPVKLTSSERKFLGEQ